MVFLALADVTYKRQKRSSGTLRKSPSAATIPLAPVLLQSLPRVQDITNIVHITISVRPSPVQSQTVGDAARCSFSSFGMYRGVASSSSECVPILSGDIARCHVPLATWCPDSIQNFHAARGLKSRRSPGSLIQSQSIFSLVPRTLCFRYSCAGK